MLETYKSENRFFASFGYHHNFCCSFQFHFIFIKILTKHTEKNCFQFVCVIWMGSSEIVYCKMCILYLVYSCMTRCKRVIYMYVRTSIIIINVYSTTTHHYRSHSNPLFIFKFFSFRIPNYNKLKIWYWRVQIMNGLIWQLRFWFDGIGGSKDGHDDELLHILAIHSTNVPITFLFNNLSGQIGYRADILNLLLVKL